MNTLISCRTFIEYNETIGHLYIPNLFVRVIHENGGYFLKTNNIGFRSDIDYNIQKREGIKRVMFFGDSFTAGDGVENSQRFSDLLGDMIKEIEVFNFGLSHSGTDQQFLIFREFAKVMKPDLIVISPLLENIRRNMKSELLNQSQDGQFFKRPKPYFKIQSSGLSLFNRPVPKAKLFEVDAGPTDAKPSIASITTSKIKQSVFKKLGIKTNLYPEYDSENREEWKLMKSILAEWINEADCPVILSPIPWYHQFEHPEIYMTENYIERFKSFESNSKFILCNLLDQFKKYDLDERKSFTYNFDKHFSPAGHRVVAESLIMVIKSILKIN